MLFYFLSERERDSDTSVSEEKSGIIVRDDGAGLPICVLLLLEELYERVSHAIRRPFLRHLMMMMMMLMR